MDVLVTSLGWGGNGIVVLHFLGARLREALFPLVDFRMPISEGEPCGSIVVGGRLIDYLGNIRIKETRIVDAVRMLIEIDPRLRRPGNGEIGRYLDVLVNLIERTSFCIAVPNPNIA